MKSNLTLRVLSALVLAPVVLVCIFLGDPAYNILVATMGAVMAWEWEKMITEKTTALSLIIGSLAVMIAFVTRNYPAEALALMALGAVFVYFKSGKNLLLSFGVFYICIPVFSLIYIAYYSGYNDLDYSFIYILWLLFVVWATDIGGYVFGKSIGGPKLVPKISPKKTWAGLIGAMASAALITYVLVLTMNHYYEEGLSVSYFVISSVVLAVISQIGDIFESAIKRSLDLKDSSNLIPGHGGIFDRVDGLLFAAPAVAIFVLMNNFGLFE